MSLVSEFKEFISRGNVVDLAVGVIIGGAFGKIVSSLVADIIMPFISIIVGAVNFKDLSFVLKDAVDETAAVTLNYGMFIQNIFDFLIIAASIFMFIKLINNFKRKKEDIPAPPPEPNKQELLLEEIRDILKNK